MLMKIIQKEKAIFEMEREGEMKVPGMIFATPSMMEGMKKDRTLWQLGNVAQLDGIIKSAMLMPDGHEGYGFPIGGVAAFDAEDGIVSPGGVGYDINCGVRLLTTSLDVKEVKPKIREICDKLFVDVPSGVGSEGKLRVTPAELDEVSQNGIDWAIEKGYGRKQDKERTEEYGRMAGAEPSVVSPTAKKRGKAQIGTLGAGNHFLEVQVVEKIFDEKAAKSFGLHEGMVTVMIHCGSRGFGHQICSDHLESVMGAAKRLNLPMPDRELVYAPLREKEAQNYLKAMKCAVNYAFTNRHVIMHWARESFDSVFSEGTGEKMDLVYDVAHNIAKEEMHSVDGKKRKLLVHRKGATRAFPKGREELPPLYRNVGQPVIIPGSMGTASYVLVGKERSLELSWGSTCHGSGRTMSRHSAIDRHRGQDIAKDLWGRGIYVRATDKKTLAEEAPDAYKNVDEVVKSVEEAGLSGIVARLRPLGVVKG
ncbi:RtcB family protein [Candidatus Micrarchaeota archaeon]|nr:RtcB family protein [Candidatus Micrarchaeota archaeon]